MALLGLHLIQWRPLAVELIALPTMPLSLPKLLNGSLGYFTFLVMFFSHRNTIRLISIVMGNDVKSANVARAVKFIGCYNRFISYVLGQVKHGQERYFTAKNSFTES